MSGWSELRSLGVQFGPPDLPLPPEVGNWSRFRAPWAETIALLARELRMLDARAIVVELDLTADQLRQDGLPYADARFRSQSVRISFTSKWGPLRYETGEYRHWQDNLRAIALSMEALRAVDRYGVSKRGEQYRGWKALPTGTNPVDAIATPEIAHAYLAQWDGDLRRAVKATHPDAGGDPIEFQKVMRAKELIGA